MEVRNDIHQSLETVADFAPEVKVESEKVEEEFPANDEVMDQANDYGLNVSGPNDTIDVVLAQLQNYTEESQLSSPNY